MQNNENHPNRRRIRNFFREKGYYIVLGLCVCAVGVSGWLFVSNAVSEKRSLQSETLSIATSAEDPLAADLRDNAGMSDGKLVKRHGSRSFPDHAMWCVLNVRII